MNRKVAFAWLLICMASAFLFYNNDVQPKQFTKELNVQVNIDKQITVTNDVMLESADSDSPFKLSQGIIFVTSNYKDGKYFADKQTFQKGLWNVDQGNFKLHLQGNEDSTFIVGYSPKSAGGLLILWILRMFAVCGIGMILVASVPVLYNRYQRSKQANAFWKRIER